MRRLALLPFLALPLHAEEALVDYVVVDASSIPAPLAPGIASADDGRALFAEAGCAGCHDGAGASDLGDVGARLSPGEIRLMIVDPRVTTPDIAMPAYYSVGVFGEAAEEMVGRTRLTAIEVEALVAYLSAAR